MNCTVKILRPTFINTYWMFINFFPTNSNTNKALTDWCIIIIMLKLISAVSNCKFRIKSMKITLTIYIIFRKMLMENKTKIELEEL
jgi:hypothetical protein